MANRGLRVAVCGIQHESNTFVRRPTGLTDFAADLLLEGEQVVARMSAAHHEVGGFIEGLRRGSVECVPAFFARALPGGTIDPSTGDHLTQRLLDCLDRHGPFDGLLVAMHGAAVCGSADNFDLHWLGAVHERFAGVPLIATCDPHANLSPKMSQLCDALIAYRTNPHLDQRERGLEAAGMMLDTLGGLTSPVTSVRAAPYVINIERQLSGTSPMSLIESWLDETRAVPGVLSASCAMGFPYADVPDMGTSFVVVADSDRALADVQCARLESLLLANRALFKPELISPQAAVERAMRLPGPVVVLDMGDNVGGGSPGDGTVLLAELVRARCPSAFVTIFDPDSVAHACSIGLGATSRFHIGGKFDPSLGAAVETDAAVRWLGRGTFTETRPRHGGATEFDMGDTAVVLIPPGISVTLTTRRLFPVSLGQYAACGLDPSAVQIIVAKGVHAPVAAYQQLAKSFIRANTPGPTCADLATRSFRRVSVRHSGEA